MLLLNSDDIAMCFTMQDAVNVQREVFGALGNGHVQQPTRIHLDVGDAGTTLVMPALVGATEAALGVKVVSVFPGDRSIPPISGAVLLLDHTTGEPAALLDGSSITAMRTAAASAVATDLLARRDACDLGVFGAGTQARAHIRAMRCVRPLRSVRIVSRTPSRAEALAEDSCCDGLTVSVVSTAREALDRADMVCTTTTSDVPVFEGSDVGPGVHVNAVGAYKPTSRELPANLMAKSRVFVDSVDDALVEAGDILMAIDEGFLDKASVVGGYRTVDHRSSPGTYHRRADYSVQVSGACRSGCAHGCAMRGGREGCGRRY